MVVVHRQQITLDSHRLMRGKRNYASQQLLPAKAHFQDLLGGGLMSSYLSEVCYSANQDFLIMSFIKTEKTQDTLDEDNTEVREKGQIFIAGSRKTFELAAKGIFVNMKSMNPAGNFLFHKYFSGH